MNLFKLMATIGVDSSEFNQGIEKAKGSTNSLADFIKKVGIAAAVGKIGKASVDMGMTFEASMSQVAATMGMTKEEIDGGSDSFKLLEKAAKEAGATTQFSATESAEALNYLALAGYDAEGAVKMLPKVLNLAAAGGMDLARASDMVTDSMSALGIETKDANRFIDQMAKTSQKSNTNVAQLGEAILTVGGTAKVLKGGTAELNTQLGILADNGIKGAEGGTALRNIILSLSSPTDQAAKLMKKLGLEVFDASGKMRATNDIFNNLNRILGTMTEQKRTQVLSELFNKVDLKSANALLANSGKRFNELSNQILNSEDAASNMAETMNSNLNGAIITLKSGLEGLAITIYDSFKEPLTNGVEAVTKGISVLNKMLGIFIGHMKNGNVVGDALYNTVIELFGEEMANKVDKIYKAVLLLVSAFVGLNTAIAVNKIITFGSSIVAITGRLIKAASMVKSLSGAMAILNAVMSANPLGLVATAIGALVGAFMYLWGTSEGFRNFWIGVWENIKQFTNTAIQAISNFFTVTIPNAIQNMITWFSELPSRISEFLTQTIEGVKSWATEMSQKAIETGTNFINSIKEWFSELPNRISEFLTLTIERIRNWTTEMVQKAIETGTNFINSVKEWFSQLPYNIGYAIGVALASIAKWSVETWEKAKETGRNFLTAITEWFQQLPVRISQFVDETWTKIETWALDMWNKAREVGVNFLTSITEWFQQVPVKVNQFISDTWNKVSTWASNMWNKAKETGMNFLNGIIQWFQQLPSRIYSWLTTTINKVITFGNNMKNKAQQIARDFSTWLINGVKDLPNKFSNIGKNIVQGVWNGIVGMKNWIMDKVSGFFSGILDGVKSIFGIHSPSRVFRDEVGKWIPAGVEVGVEQGMPSLKRSVEDNMATLTDVEIPTMQANPRSFDNNNSEIIELLRIIASKDFNLQLDGRELTRGIAPYQEELTEYNMLRTI